MILFINSCFSCSSWLVYLGYLMLSRCFTTCIMTLHSAAQTQFVIISVNPPPPPCFFSPARSRARWKTNRYSLRRTSVQSFRRCASDGGLPCNTQSPFILLVGWVELQIYSISMLHSLSSHGPHTHWQQQHHYSSTSRPPSPDRKSLTTSFSPFICLSLFSVYMWGRGGSLTGFPGYPGWPGCPGNPSWPGNPLGPTGPMWPTSPFFPSAPLRPSSPVTPFWGRTEDSHVRGGRRWNRLLFLLLLSFFFCSNWPNTVFVSYVKISRASLHRDVRHLKSFLFHQHLQHLKISNI